MQARQAEKRFKTVGRGELQIRQFEPHESVFVIGERIIHSDRHRCAALRRINPAVAQQTESEVLFMGRRTAQEPRAFKFLSD